MGSRLAIEELRIVGMLCCKPSEKVKISNADLEVEKCFSDTYHLWYVLLLPGNQGYQEAKCSLD